MSLPPRRSVPSWLPATQHGSANRNRTQPAAETQQGQFRSLNASLLYCPRCKVATPTRERLLLVLPSGNLYEYRCIQCGTSTGSKTDHPHGKGQILSP
ncbi:MAG: hypothetical protein FJ244_06085 [Nitrospira sp.]|nr:hypothetical protein [Nitrospira sp.]